jgi:hypothetical protein
MGRTHHNRAVFLSLEAIAEILARHALMSSSVTSASGDRLFSAAERSSLSGVARTRHKRRGPLYVGHFETLGACAAAAYHQFGRMVAEPTRCLNFQAMHLSPTAAKMHRGLDSPFRTDRYPTWRPGGRNDTCSPASLYLEGGCPIDAG